MSDPTDLNKFKKTQRKAKARNATMCRRGFHKWSFDKAKQFDVKLGKLVSIQRCDRCGVSRTHVQ